MIAQKLWALFEAALLTSVVYCGVQQSSAIKAHPIKLRAEAVVHTPKPMPTAMPLFL